MLKGLYACLWVIRMLSRPDDRPISTYICLEACLYAYMHAYRPIMHAYKPICMLIAQYAWG